VSSNAGAIMASSPRKGTPQVAPSNSLVRNYEIQRYSGGRWVVDSVADEKDVAISMAQSLLKNGKGAHGVRVMAVQTKPSGEFAQITIFRRVPGEAEAAPAAPAPKPAPKAEVKPETEKRDFKHVDPPAKPVAPKKGGQVMLALKVAFIVGFAAVAFEAIRILGK
jgi:hypothetical protein